MDRMHATTGERRSSGACASCRRERCREAERVRGRLAMARRPELKKADETAAALEQFAEMVRVAELTPPSRKRVLAAIADMKDALRKLERNIDPIRLPDAFFDPSEPR